MGPSRGSVDARPGGVVRRSGFHREAKFELQHKNGRGFEVLNPRQRQGVASYLFVLSFVTK